MTADKTYHEDRIRILHPEYKKLGNGTLAEKMSYHLREWFSFLDIYIIVAQNEQQPWTSAELGFKTKPMFLKKDVDHQQVGDYQILVDGTGAALGECFSSLLVKRKGCTYNRDDRGCLTMVGCDLYQTLMNRPGREKFYREIDRFHTDPRFDRMVVMCECTYEQFLSFKPPFKWVYNPDTEKKEKAYNPGDHSGATRASRIATVNGLFERGVSVRFLGSRERAVEAYRSMIKLNVLRCYERFICGSGRG